jgi:hypothetical protein
MKRTLFLLCLWACAGLLNAASPDFKDFNVTQFGTNGNKIAIKSGALQTNGLFSSSLKLNGADVLTNAPGSGITNSGTGTADTLAKWTDTNSLGNSTIVDDGSGNFQFGSAGLVAVHFFPPNNPMGDGTDLTFDSGSPGVDGRGGDISFLATDGTGNGRGGNLNFTAGEGQGTGVGGKMTFAADADDGSISFEATGNNGAINLTADAKVEFFSALVLPNVTSSLGNIDQPWAEIFGSVGTFLNGLIVTNNVFFDGQLDMTGNANIGGSLTISGQTSFPYTDDGTQLLRDGVPVGGGGTQVWTNDGGAYPVSPIVLVRPRTDNTANLGTNNLRWLTVWSYGEDVDGDIRVSGNVSPRDVPYIWPVAQGAADTELVNDGGGILSWAPRTNGLGFFRDLSIEPGAMFPAPTAATLTQYTNTVNETLSDAWVFADAATQATRFSISLPDLWDKSTVKLRLYVTSNGTNVATTTNLVWGVKAGSMSPGEALTNAVFGTQVFVTNGLSTVGNVMQVFTTPAITVGGSPATGDSLWFDISRQGSNASDTWTNTVFLLKARLQYKESTTAPASW